MQTGSRQVTVTSKEKCDGKQKNGVENEKSESSHGQRNQARSNEVTAVIYREGGVSEVPSVPPDPEGSAFVFPISK